MGIYLFGRRPVVRQPTVAAPSSNEEKKAERRRRQQQQQLEDVRHENVRLAARVSELEASMARVLALLEH